MSVLRNLENRTRRPRRGHVRPGLPLRGATRRARAQAGQGDGRAPHRVGFAHLRPQRVPRLAVARRSRALRRRSSTRSSTSSSGYLLEHARRERLALDLAPEDRVPHRRPALPGRVRHPGAAGARRRGAQAAAPRRLEPAGHGHTMIYSAADRDQRAARRGPGQAGRPWSSWRGKRYSSGRPGPSSVAAASATSSSTTRTCHAGTPRSGPARTGWTVADMGWTNGVRVNGRPVRAAPQPLRARRPGGAGDRSGHLRDRLNRPCSSPSPSC